MRRAGSAQQRALAAQRNEITEHHIYSRLAERMRREDDREVLKHLANHEKEHYGIWREITGREVEPVWWKVSLYSGLARLFGLNFGLQLMEKGEELAQENYDDLKQSYPQIAKLVQDEQQHEEKLLGMINERLLSYVGSIVLGLNDALVELTGALAGLTLALQNTQLIAMVGFITGFAASLSMGASEYLSTKEEGRDKAWQAGVVTGITYLITVLILIAPYFVVSNSLVALGITLSMTVIIIFVFTGYTAVAKRLPFKNRFATMALISLTVAVINFGMGIVVKNYFGIDV